VEGAQHLLETTRSTVDEVASKVGYANSIALRRLLQEQLGRSAREIRAARIRRDRAAAR
jgi:transcriptional regulator GlxA family with amidase domain